MFLSRVALTLVKKMPDPDLRLMNCSPTKMRALYQRKEEPMICLISQTALEHADVDPGRIVETFLSYMKH